MQSVKMKDTGPERAVRKALFALGFRFRLHRKNLPGSPDIVFPSRRKAIFVHGCFWHGHDCAKGKLPKSRIEYWGQKVEANRARDERNLREINSRGWQSYVVWECELKNRDDLLTRLGNFLGPPRNPIDKDKTPL